MDMDMGLMGRLKPHGVPWGPVRTRRRCHVSLLGVEPVAFSWSSAPGAARALVGTGLRKTVKLNNGVSGDEAVK